MGKKGLIEYLESTQGFRSMQLRRAFDEIDRRDFVRGEYFDDAYGDYPLPIGFGQTISQPATVLFMVSLLDPRPGEKILDIGSGSGWTTALLATAIGDTGQVFGIEIVPDLVEFGRSNLAKYHLPQAKILPAGETIGFPQKAPFDKILVSASAHELPEGLLAQLKLGGRLVLPIENSVWKIDKVSETKINREEFPGFAFVPLR